MFNHHNANILLLLCNCVEYLKRDTVLYYVIIPATILSEAKGSLRMGMKKMEKDNSENKIMYIVYTHIVKGRGIN